MQKECITNGKEEFTVGMVKKVAKEQFKLMKPMIEAIKSKNPYKIAQLEDLRRLEFTDFSVPRNEKLTSTIEKVSKTQQNTKEIPKAIIASTEPKVKQGLDYAEDDLRGLWKEASKTEKTIYQLLVDNEYVDDMSFWQEEGRI